MVWAIWSGPREIMARAVHFPQSILYCFLMWSVSLIGGMNEISLRLPSLMVTILASCLLYNLVLRLFDPTTASLSAVIWALLPVTTYYATAARPYAFGTLAVIASYWALVRWMQSPSTMTWMSYISLSALPAYFSYLFVVVLIAQAAYVVARVIRVRSVPMWQLVSTPLCTAVLLGPLLPGFLAAGSARGAHTYLTVPNIKNVLYELIPHSFAFGLAAAFLLWSLLPKRSFYRPTMVPSDTAVLIATWTLVPILCTFAVSRLTATTLFTPRYFMEASPGLAILFGCLVRGFDPAFFRSLTIACVAFFAAVAPVGSPNYWRPRPLGDFRAASAFLAKFHEGKEIPVYAFSAFIEGARMPFPVSELDKSFLLAPLLVYPVATEVTILPSELHDGTVEYIRRVLDSMGRNVNGFLLYTGDPKSLPDWFSEAVTPSFKRRILHEKNDVSVVLYTRR